MSFLRHGEIFQSDGKLWGLPVPVVGTRRSGSLTAPPPLRVDEFPAGYSSAGCSPAEPASASPANASMGGPQKRDNKKTANVNLSLFGLSQVRGPVQPGVSQRVETRFESDSSTRPGREYVS
jgi:hypothetical protein